MEVAHSSESPVFIYQSIRHHIPEGSYNVVLCGRKILYIEDENCTLSWSANSIFNLLAPELNFQCSLQNPWFKLQDFFFLAKLLNKRKGRNPHRTVPEWTLLADTYLMSFRDCIVHPVMQCIYCQTVESISAIKRTSHINLGFQVIMINTQLKTGS